LFADGSHPTNTTIGATTMTTKARIDGLRFAITSPGKPHASSVLIPKDAKAIAQFITTATAALLAVFAIAATPLAYVDDTVNDLICQKSRMGLSPDQIAASVHSGDPTCRRSSHEARC
jgi:hypothetical protein